MITIDELKVQLADYGKAVKDLEEALAIDASRKRVQELEHTMSRPGFYDDADLSKKVFDEVGDLKGKLSRFEKLQGLYDDAETMLEMLDEEYDPAMIPEAEESVNAVGKAVDELQLMTMLNGEYDHSNAILTFHAGTGGTEAQDWAEMLYRMYNKWASNHGMTVEVLDYQDGDEAGMKSASMMVKGANAYGLLKSENGVHRLVRVSPFDANARRKEEYGYGIYENVITSVELENMFYNHSIKMANGNTPKRIGIIHCVGSRDEKVCNYHCSKLCCITGVKQAIELRELLPDTEIFCFYMDMRMFGPGYEEMYREAQEKYNIKFVRGRLSEAAENLNKQLQIKVEDTLVGKPLRMTLDMMVLLVGMESSEGSRQMADTLGLNLAPNGFIKSQDPHYRNNNTNVEGVFVAGCGSAPMNLTDTLADARSAAMNIIEYIKRI